MAFLRINLTCGHYCAIVFFFHIANIYVSDVFLENFLKFTIVIKNILYSFKYFYEYKNTGSLVGDYIITIFRCLTL